MIPGSRAPGPEQVALSQLDQSDLAVGTTCSSWLGVVKAQGGEQELEREQTIRQLGRSSCVLPRRPKPAYILPDFSLTCSLFRGQS